jgi:hypothetical protein
MTFATLPLLCVGTDGAQVVSEARGIDFANLMQFFDDGIALHYLNLNQFLGRAYDGWLVAEAPDQRLYFGPKRRIGNMRAVPGQQIVHTACHPPPIAD